jgi:hypothetical protein
MYTHSQDMNQAFKVSYYSSKKVWQLESLYSIWPFFASFTLLILQGLFSGGNDLTAFLLFLTFFLCLCCILVTRFYANAVLKVSERELILAKNGKSISYEWANISNAVFLIPLNGRADSGIVLVIHTNDNIEYIIIDNLYFTNAKSRATKIGYEMEKFLKGFKFSIQKSDFAPRMFDKEIGPPNILP